MNFGNVVTGVGLFFILDEFFGIKYLPLQQ